MVQAQVVQASGQPGRVSVDVTLTAASELDIIDRRAG